MSARAELLASIAETIKDYRAGEIARPTVAHVDRWVKQFDAEAQVPILREMDHVLQKTYFSFEVVTTFLKQLLRIKKLVGADPCSFWRSSRFLDIQGGGNSQREMLALLDQLLKKECGFGIARCGKAPSAFIYLDDGIFTGNRVRRDLEAWVEQDAPATATVHVLTIALHSGGQHYAATYIHKAAKAAGKNIDVTWWRAIELEDRRFRTDSSDVLRPATIPDVPAVRRYVKGMTHKPNLRTPGNVGSNSLFSSESGRSVLEQEFLKAGVSIRRRCPNLGETQRPLGHITLVTLGFGSLIVTFRNCPNNAPLALWVGDPWYPLFPRTTNSQTEIKRMFDDLTGSG